MKNVDCCQECGVSINNGSRYCPKCQQYFDTEALVLRQTFPDTNLESDDTWKTWIPDCECGCCKCKKAYTVTGKEGKELVHIIYPLCINSMRVLIDSRTREDHTQEEEKLWEIYMSSSSGPIDWEYEFEKLTRIFFFEGYQHSPKNNKNLFERLGDGLDCGRYWVDRNCSICGSKIDKEMAFDFKETLVDYNAWTGIFGEVLEPRYCSRKCASIAKANVDLIGPCFDDTDETEDYEYFS